MQKRHKSNILSKFFFQKNIIKSFRFAIPPFCFNCYLDENPLNACKRTNKPEMKGIHFENLHLISLGH